MIEVIRQFMPDLLAGFLVNLEIAAGAVIIGLCVGVPFAILRQKVPASRHVVWPCVRLMQAVPTYVIMYFALSLLPRDLPVFGTPGTRLIAVILAQAVYMIPYVAENFYRSLEHLQRHERDLALLFLPNLLRGTVLVVMSSGFAAAIGVSEAVGVTVHQAERLHLVADRIVLFLVVIGLFVAVFGIINVLIRVLMRRLTRPLAIA